MRNGFLRAAAAITAAALIALQPAAAQSILRDAETEALLDEMAAPLAKAAGLAPGNLDVVLINDPSINAFVVGGQTVYIHSGLIQAADDAGEVQGVIAHEIGHIEGGHVIRFSEGMATATGITLVSLLLGVAAIAAGAGDAGAGILAAGQQAAMGKFLAFNRAQENSADAAGARYMNAAGISGRGSIDFFKKLQNQEFRLAIPQEDSYARTHPLSGERIAALEGNFRNQPAWDKPTDPKLQARFLRVKAKLEGFIQEPPQTMRDFPASNTSVPAHYARAYAWHRGAYPDKAVEEVNALIAADPHDPYFLELKGQVLLESGKPEEALAPLREAVERSGGSPLIATTFGHALLATESPANLDEAERVLRRAVARDRENPFAWYSLGVAYARKGDTARAALATAERHSLQGQHRLALISAEQAMGQINSSSPDWLRAQDIAMASRAELENERGNRRR
ncbi:peptidase M48 [Sphingomonas gilva]|uniref:Peptidase M48 n=1 Tax=Sphingomonas gilva TaxID=2305907 RepID=A0A396RNA6_9SPHN|nr:M48 family metalloprotease [Sphingomonas gilva]RHW17967.1 peptidase M48 [Sphingomonas gilva]